MIRVSVFVSEGNVQGKAERGGREQHFRMPYVLMGRRGLARDGLP